MTLVFTDIEGSTRLVHELGERYAEVLADHRRPLRRAFAGGGGVEVDTQGDAFFFAFSGAGRALAAVAEAQRALASHAWPEGRELRVRVGAHTGEPQTTCDRHGGGRGHERPSVAGYGRAPLLRPRSGPPGRCAGRSSEGIKR